MGQISSQGAGGRDGQVQGDLLAVGYGSRSFGQGKKGGLAVWSIKRPTQPIWLCETGCGVSSLDFSRHNGSMLAVGFLNGCLMIYDLKSRQVPSPARGSWCPSPIPIDNSQVMIGRVLS